MMYRNRNCHSYRFPPCSRAKFPQTWPRSKLASATEPSTIGGASSLLSLSLSLASFLMCFTFSATCSLATRHFFSTLRITRIYLSPLDKITNQHTHLSTRARVCVCAPRSQTLIRACKYLPGAPDPN